LEFGFWIADFSYPSLWSRIQLGFRRSKSEIRILKSKIKMAGVGIAPTFSALQTDANLSQLSSRFGFCFRFRGRKFEF
jgi:hypothetical protein